MKRWLAFAALAAFVGFGLCAAAQDQNKTAPPEKSERPGPHAWLKEALKLTPDQEAKIKEFRQAREADRKAFGEQMSKIRDDVRALREGGSLDPAKVDPLIDRMFKLRADRVKAALRRSRDFRKIFTPEQLETLKEAGRRFVCFGRFGRFRGRMPMMRGWGWGSGFGGPMGRDRSCWERGGMMGGRGFDRGPGESDPEPGMDPGSDFEQELGPEADFGPDSEFGPGMNVDLILFLLGRGD